MNDSNPKPDSTIELHIFGDAAEVEETAALLRQALNVLEESPNYQDPDMQEDDPTRVRRRLIVQDPSKAE
jgi:hypothetical protein